MLSRTLRAHACGSHLRRPALHRSCTGRRAGFKALVQCSSAARQRVSKCAMPLHMGGVGRRLKVGPYPPEKVLARIPRQRGKCKARLPCRVVRFTSSWLEARSVGGGRDETVCCGRSDTCAHATWLCSGTCCLLVWTCCPVRCVCACFVAVAATSSVRALPCGLKIGPPAYGQAGHRAVVLRHARHTRIHVCSGPPFVRNA